MRTGSFWAANRSSIAILARHCDEAVDDDAAEAAALLAPWGIKRSMTEKEMDEERLRTVLLLGGLLLFMGLLSIIPNMSLHSVICIDHPGECDEALLAFANFLGGPALLIIFFASTVVSVVLLIRRRRGAFYVPLIGAAAMIGCFAVWMILVSNGFLIPFP